MPRNVCPEVSLKVAHAKSGLDNDSAHATAGLSRESGKEYDERVAKRQRDIAEAELDLDCPNGKFDYDFSQLDFGLDHDDAGGHVNVGDVDEDVDVGQDDVDVGGHVACVDHYGNVINATESDGTIMYAAMGSGAVAHVASPEDVPGDCEVVNTPESRELSFMAANGKPMENHGQATVGLESEDGAERLGNTFNLTDVTRPLHSSSAMADCGNDVLITKGYAVVVPEGVVAAVLKTGRVRVKATYPRRGGLYVGKFRARAARRPQAGAKTPAPRRNVVAKASGFARPGGTR